MTTEDYPTFHLFFFSIRIDTRRTMAAAAAYSSHLGEKGAISTLSIEALSLSHSSISQKRLYRRI